MAASYGGGGGPPIVVLGPNDVVWPPTSLPNPGTTLLSGLGMWNSLSRQVAFMQASPGYCPSVDPNLPTHTFLDGNLTPTGNVVTVSNIALLPVPNQSVGQFGSVRAGSEVIIYSDVFTGNSSVHIVQRNVNNTGNLSANIPDGSLISVLGLRSIPISQSVKTFMGNLAFTASNIGLGYYSANVSASIAPPDLKAGNTAVIGSVYLWANGAVQSVSITNAGTGYFTTPVVTITGPNTYAFIGTADLTTV